MATEIPFQPTLRALAALGRRAAKVSVSAGILQDDAGKDDDDGIRNADLAAVLEFGVMGDEGWRIPPRPAYADAAKDNGVVWVRLFERGISELVAAEFSGSGGGAPSLDLLGVKMRGDIRQNIPYWSVPNADTTIEMKGSDAPIVDTGNYANSIKARADDGKRSKVVG